MDFTTETKGHATVITVEGNLMGGPDATALNGKLHELLAAGKKLMVLDLSRVGFINSSGLGLLIGGINAVRSEGGRLTVAGASEKIMTLIKITKLEKVIETHPTVSAALASMKK